MSCPHPGCDGMHDVGADVAVDETPMAEAIVESEEIEQEAITERAVDENDTREAIAEIEADAAVAIAEAQAEAAVEIAQAEADADVAAAGVIAAALEAPVDEPLEDEGAGELEDEPAVVEPEGTPPVQSVEVPTQVQEAADARNARPHKAGRSNVPAFRRRRMSR